MKTLQEDLDDLDRMVDGSASKDAIRSQIRLISREVAALEADKAGLIESNAKLDNELTAANARHITAMAAHEKPAPEDDPDRAFG